MQFIACRRFMRLRHGSARSILLAMKLTAIFILLACLQTSARGFGQTVSLSEKNASLDQVFRKIQKQTGYSFVYTDNVLRKAQPITIQVKDASITEVLENCFRNQPLTYTLFNRMVVVNEKSPGNANAVNSQIPAVDIHGRVLNEKGEPLAGASVSEKGTGKATSTNNNGEFTITVSSTRSSLLVSFVGYESREFNLEGNVNPVITLKVSEGRINEVVVTALGFETSRDKLGYATSRVSGEQVAGSGEAGLVDALGGKASGVRVSRSSGSDPGSASQILIRGQSTITRGTDPLIVLDGIPINGGSRGDGSGQTTQQSRLNDINPDDIASIQVLKGASAAALWGTKAANGVLIITTKKGGGNRTSITIKSTWSIDEVSSFYDLQTKYGQGTNGVYSPTNTRSWGDLIANRAGGEDTYNMNGARFVGYDGRTYYPVTQKNSKDIFTQKNYDAVLGRGHYMDNSVSLSSGDTKNNYFFSLSDLNQQGVIRDHSSYRRTSMRLNVNRQLNNWLSFSNKATYSLINSDRVQRGINNAGFMIALLRTPPDFDNSTYIGKYASSPSGAFVEGRQRSYRNYLGSSSNPGFNNPLWDIYQLVNTSSVNRFINSAEMNIKPVSWFNFTTRAGLDYFTDRQLNFYPYNSTNANTGQYQRDEYSEMQFNLDLIARAEKTFSPKFSGNALIGFNYNALNTGTLTNTSQNFIIQNGPMDLSNATPANISTGDGFSKVRSNAGYASVGLGFMDQLYLNATGRLEAASTFGQLSENRFFYPSADIAWQFTELKALRGKELLSFGKIRASYGVVGIQPQVYQTSTPFVTTTFNDNLGGSLDPGLYGSGTYLQSVNKGNAYLRPERKQEVELGTDLRFFDNKVQLGFTWYHNKTIDALINIPQAASTGYANLYANAGSIENRGVEIDLGYQPIRKQDWDLSFDVNFSKNRNRVLNLNGAGSIDLGGSAGVSSRAVEGYSLGVLYSIPWVRDDKGALKLDANGFPIPDVTSAVIGDPNPDWRGGIGFRLRYKQLYVSALVEHSQGGVVVNGTEAVLVDYGVSATTGNESTATVPLKRYGGGSYAAGTTFRGNIYDFGGGPVALDQNWYTGPGGWFGNVGEQFVEDATWTRLRDVAIGYNLNIRSLKKLIGLNSLNLELSGRNLLLFSNVNGYDPDSNVAGSSTARGVIYFVNPPTRSYLFTVKLGF